MHAERVLGSWVVWLPKRMPRLHVTGVKVTNISESETTSYALFLVKSKKRKKRAKSRSVSTVVGKKAHLRTKR